MGLFHVCMAYTKIGFRVVIPYCYRRSSGGRCPLRTTKGTENADRRVGGGIQFSKYSEPRHKYEQGTPILESFCKI
ncbi:hypothetical protein KC19_VG230400 [Ceratodon purpureus]|uniref:Uncharacterized protein n=1 Tax=Ceratodon purpureus TaxID=3225 RepID=A0A8T0HTI7_CERPU|nr:hypothetical protein KC19_VG230400 [Ceratodon purpureus]